MIKGLNFSKDEFIKCSEIYKELVSCSFNEIENMFERKMRERFGYSVSFENLLSKQNDNDIKITVCCFKKNRPLVFLVTDSYRKNWSLVDEKRLPEYGSKSFPFNNATV